MAQLPTGVNLTNVPFGPPPPGIESNFINPVSFAPTVAIVGGLVITLETLLLFIRLFSNYKLFGKFRFDDWVVTLGVLLTYGYFAMLLAVRPVDLHQWDIRASIVSDKLLSEVFTEEILLGPMQCCSKSALLLLYLRIFSSDRAFRYKIYATLAFTVVITLMSFPMYLAICLPGVDGNTSWPSAVSHCDKKTGSLLIYIQSPSILIIDVIILYLPTSMIIGMNMPLKRKIGVFAIFMTGLCALAASIAGIVYRVELIHTTNDLTWATAQSTLLVLVECVTSLMCACMPSIPSFSKTIAQHSYFVSLRSRIFTRQGSSNLPETSKNTPKKPGTFLARKIPNDSQIYHELVDTPSNYRDTLKSSETQIHHIEPKSSLANEGIEELEMSSTKNSVHESGSL